MTTPACPRCTAPLTLGRDYPSHEITDRVWCDAPGCAYGHDAPRTLIPQPDPPTRNGAYDLLHAVWHALDDCEEQADGSVILTVEHAEALSMLVPEEHPQPDVQPAPTPQRTDAGGVADNGLLPCPFCGGPAFDDFDDPDGSGHIVGCDNRACPVNPEKFMDHVGEDHDVRADLRAAWNTRSTP